MTVLTYKLTSGLKTSLLEQRKEGLNAFRTSDFEELLHNVIMCTLSPSSSVPVLTPGD